MFAAQYSDIPWNAVQLGAPPPHDLQSGQPWGQSEPGMDHPALPALWWLGILIALIVIRVLSKAE